MSTIISQTKTPVFNAQGVLTGHLIHTIRPADQPATPEAPNTLTAAVKLQVQQGQRTPASIALMDQTPPRRAPAAVCKTCRAVTCRCGVPPAPETLALVVQRQREQRS